MSSIQAESGDKLVPAAKAVHTVDGYAVHGETSVGTGVVGTSEAGVGVWGHSVGSTGTGGVSVNGVGVDCISEAGAGSRSVSKTGPGIWAASDGNEGIHVETRSRRNGALVAINVNPDGDGAAIYGEKRGRIGHAGYFVGDVAIQGRLTVSGIDPISLLQTLEQKVRSLEAELRNMR